MTDQLRYKQELYGQFARIGGALASDRRLELLDLLAQGSRHVEALARESRMSVANVSQHLQTLRSARLVESEREGNRVVYRLADESVLRLWHALRVVGQERLAELDQLAQAIAPPGIADGEVSRDDLRAILQGDEVLVLDVRPSLEYEHGHLPGARSVPLEALAEQMQKFPRDRRIVAYCRGTYCLFADEAVALLRENGFDAVRLDGGWLVWAVEESSDGGSDGHPALARSGDQA